MVAIIINSRLNLILSRSSSPVNESRMCKRRRLGGSTRNSCEWVCSEVCAIPCLEVDHASGSASKHLSLRDREILSALLKRGDCYLRMPAERKNHYHFIMYFAQSREGDISKIWAPFKRLSHGSLPIGRLGRSGWEVEYNASNGEIFMHALIIFGSWPFVLGHSTLMPRQNPSMRPRHPIVSQIFSSYSGMFVSLSIEHIMRREWMQLLFSVSLNLCAHRNFISRDQDPVVIRKVRESFLMKTS